MIVLDYYKVSLLYVRKRQGCLQFIIDEAYLVTAENIESAKVSTYVKRIYGYTSRPNIKLTIVDSCLNKLSADILTSIELQNKMLNSF